MKLEKKLLNDEYAKKIFRSEDCREYVASVIAVVLNLKKEYVMENLTLINPNVNINENVKDQEVDTVYDTKENYINIEINYRNSKVSKIKNSAYIAQLYLKQVKPGEKYQIKPIVQININNYDYYKKNQFIYHSYVMEEEYHIVRDKNIEIYDINLDLLSKMDYNEIEKMNERDLKWLLYIFVCEDKKLRKEVYGGSEMMKKVNKKVEDYEQALDAYLFYDKKALDEAGMYEMGVDDGMIQGEKKKAIETAKRLLKMGVLNDNQIAEATGLTKAEIKKIQKEENESEKSEE